MKSSLPFLETMATQACNLSCQGCTNYSDLSYKGYVPWNTAKNWIDAWLEKINIETFGIIGGEPLLNPEVENWLYGCRELMPDSQLRFTTNGLLIKSADNLLKILDDIGNIVFKITVHVDNTKLEDTIKEIFSLRDWQPVVEYGISRWKLDNGVRFQINRPEKFIKTFNGSYDTMMPYYSDPAAAFKLCVQPDCPLLWNGRIYKCSTAGLLKDTLEKINPITKKHWENFVDAGIGPDSPMSDILQFINNFGKPNQICAQCPADHTAQILHKPTVLLKKYKPN